ncbi:MAG: HU family DNA-binding protein [Bacteroidales bacterium]
MNSKLTLSEISDMLAKKGVLSKKEAEQFLKELFQLAAEILSSGEYLAINGIGQFKQVLVAERTSVDINTGEPIQIPEHYKISLRDAVNEPFASFTTEIIPAAINISKIEEEVKSSLSEKEYKATDSIKTEEIAVEPSENTEELNIEVAALQTAKDSIKSVPETTRQDTKSEDSKDDVFDYYTRLEYKRRTRNGYIAGFCSALSILLIIAFGWYFMNKNKSSEYTLSFPPFKLTVVTHKTDTVKNKPDSTVVVKEEVKKEPYISEKDTVEETIERGKFLTTIAQKYYGNKIFWVYIYRENNGRIWNPRDLPKGFKVIVPDASKYNIDANSEKSLKQAADLERQILYEIQ